MPASHKTGLLDPIPGQGLTEKLRALVFHWSCALFSLWYSFIEGCSSGWKQSTHTEFVTRGKRAGILSWEEVEDGQASGLSNHNCSGSVSSIESQEGENSQSNVPEHNIVSSILTDELLSQNQKKNSTVGTHTRIQVCLS